MIRLLIFVLVCAGIIGLCGSATAARADSSPMIEWEKSEEGETAFVPMKSAPYPHPSRDKGYTYNKVTDSARATLLGQHRWPVHSARISPHAQS